MSRSFVTNLQRMLDENGTPVDALPLQARRLVEHLLPIITRVTTPPDPEPKSPLTCWNKIARRRCPGKIAAGIELEHMDIFWHCLSCGDHGTISHWENTRWDARHR